MPPAFKRPGCPIHKVAGTPGHGQLCCCYEEPSPACEWCNGNETPNAIEVIITADDVTDHTCVDCGAKLSGTYILMKATDGSLCSYTYCEDDPCNFVDSLTGARYKIKILFQIQDQGNFRLTIVFATPGDDPVPCNSSPNGVRSCFWERTASSEPSVWDCRHNIDHDLSHGADDTNVDFQFCHSGLGDIHVRAIS